MAQFLWLHCDPKAPFQLLDRETGNIPKIANNRDLTINIGAFDDAKPHDLATASTITFELYDSSADTANQFLTKNHTGSITERIRLSSWNALKAYNAQVVCTDDDLNYSLGSLSGKELWCKVKLTKSDGTIISLGEGALVIGRDEAIPASTTVGNLVVAADTGSQGISLGDTLTVLGDSGIQTNQTGNTLTIISGGGGGGTPRTDEEIQDVAGGMFTGNTETGISATYQDSDGTVDLVVSDLTVAADTGSTAMTPGDTLTVTGAGNISTDQSGDTLTITGAKTTNEEIEDVAGAMVTSNTETGIAVTYDDANAKLDFVVSDLTVTGDTGSTGMTPGDTLTVRGDSGTSTIMTGDTLTIIGGGKTDEEIEDVAGAMFTGNTETGITATYQDADGTVDLVVDDLTVTADTGSQAMTPGDTLTISGGGNISTSQSGDTLTITGAKTTNEEIEDVAGAMVDGNTETGIAVTYDDANAKLDFIVSDLTVAADTGSAGMTPGDTLTVAGGSGITTEVSGDTLTITNSLNDLQTWNFQTGTAPPPANNSFRYDDSTPANVANIFIDDQPNAGVDFGAVIQDFESGGHIYVQDEDGTGLQLFDISSGVSDGIGWWTIPVTHVAGGTLPTSGNACYIRYSPPGRSQMFEGNTETGITATYQASDGTVDLVVDDLTVAADTGSTAMTPGDTLTVKGDSGASTIMSGDTLTIIGGGATDEEIEDVAGAMFSGNTETGITATYQDSDGTIDLVVDDLTVTADTGSTAMTPGDTLTVTGAGNISTDQSGDTLTITGAKTTNEEIEDVAGAMVDGNTETGISVTYDDANAKLDFVVSDLTVTGDTGSTAMTPGDTLSILGDSGTSTIMSGDTLKISGVGGTSRTDEEIEDVAGAMFSGNTETGITATYQDSDGTVDLIVDDLTVTADTGSQAMTPGDTLTVTGAGNISTSQSGDTLTITGAKTTNEEIEDVAGAMFSGNTETGITATYDDDNAKLNLVVDDLTVAADTGGSTAMTPGDTLTVTGGGGIDTTMSGDTLIIGASSDMVKIASASASSDATIDFTSGISSTYKTYMLTGSLVVPATDNVGAQLQVSVSSTFQTSDYKWGSFYVLDTGGTAGSGSTSDSKISLDTSVGSASGEGCSFVLYLHNPSNTAIYKHIEGLFVSSNLSNTLVARRFAGWYNGGTGAIDGLRFSFSSGDVESGEFVLYGMK